MIPQNIQGQIISIWDKYLAENKTVLDTKGVPYHDIDRQRLDAIETLKMIVKDFQTNAIDIAEFKTDIDSFNKQNNLWGFTSIKGQMFFNLLLKTSEGENQLRILTTLLKQCVAEPIDILDALGKIEALDKYVSAIFDKAPDKRKAPNPGSVCYFL